jgi:hypothetical protein
MDNFRPVNYKIRLAFQKGFLNKVTPNLRRVHIDQVSLQIFLYFFYQTPASPLEKKFVETILDEMKMAYSHDEKGNAVEYFASIEQCSYPIKPPLEGQCVYAQYEPTPLEFHEE